jgi:uncharacterized membrane protein
MCVVRVCGTCVCVCVQALTQQRRELAAEVEAAAAEVEAAQTVAAQAQKRQSMAEAELRLATSTGRAVIAAPGTAAATVQTAAKPATGADDSAATTTAQCAAPHTWPCPQHFPQRGCIASARAQRQPANLSQYCACQILQYRGTTGNH